VELAWDTTVNLLNGYAGNGLNATASDSSFHVIQMTPGTGTNGTLNVDGAAQVTRNIGAATMASTLSIGG
jgi:hypothetical protein